ncbi:MAG: hypothetical protein JW741_00720, partial [Sedimentisphaerales bacterium]|nr:hypothetical protein [Sedimentisphaerales bacterium]
TEPVNMAMAAMAGIALLLSKADEHGLPQVLHGRDWRTLDMEGLTRLLTWLSQNQDSARVGHLVDCTYAAREGLSNLLG